MLFSSRPERLDWREGRQPTCSSRHLATILDGENVAGRTLDLKSIASRGVASVDSMFIAECLSVKGAVSTQRSAILGQDIALKEIAGPIVALGIRV